MTLHDEIIDAALGPLIDAAIDGLPDHGVADIVRNIARAAFVRGYGVALDKNPDLQLGLAATILDVAL